ncbi:GNAT family N-acetyltransferase [Aspergillus stella-maris]|uniref:GNAT family N-acetyltransferase n=1 Tax=Aspergillus stella-maris TaxID=1810926 RepID=UPI003CCD9F86
MSQPSLPEGYTLHSGSPDVESYLHLRRASGLSPKTPAQGTASIKGAWYGCYITYTDPSPTTTSFSTQTQTPIAMGRIISDGGWYFHIVDMAVLPAYQRRGLGEVILRHLLGYIKTNAPEGEPYVNLLADEPGRRLYGNLGFVDAMPGSLGMVYGGGFEGL